MPYLPLAREVRAQLDSLTEIADHQDLLLHQVVSYRLTTTSEPHEEYVFSSLDDVHVFLWRYVRKMPEF